MVRLIRAPFAENSAAESSAAISIAASALLGEYLAGAIVVLMLSGGETLEAFAVAKATSVLRALAARLPTLAHRRTGDGFEDVPVGDLAVGDEVSILPHEICPVDGEVVAGSGQRGRVVPDGRTVQSSRRAPARWCCQARSTESRRSASARRRSPADSRYAQIMRVMQEAEQRRPNLRRIGDQLGAWYTPLALTVAALAWWASGDPVRFLSVVVIATPCPLLIAIPVAIIGAISTAARRGIIVKDPAALEQLTLCRTMILDKTGTLTYGRPTLSEEFYAPHAFTRETVLPLVAAMERYSRHPLAERDPEGGWRRAPVAARSSTGSAKSRERGCAARSAARSCSSPTGRYAAATSHVPAGLGDGPGVHRHPERRVMLRRSGFTTCRGPTAAASSVTSPRCTGSRVCSSCPAIARPEVRRLADAVAIARIHAGTSPEEKVAIVRRETARAGTVFIGDGINDAPALLSATVGIAFGQHSDVTSEAARVVILDSSLSKVDDLIHLSYRLRRVALQSAVGGMVLSGAGDGVRRCRSAVAGRRRRGAGSDRPGRGPERAPNRTRPIGPDRFRRGARRFLRLRLDHATRERVGQAVARILERLPRALHLSYRPVVCRFLM